MPSRKKAKGKERKAKAAAAKIVELEKQIDSIKNDDNKAIAESDLVLDQVEGVKFVFCIFIHCTFKKIICTLKKFVLLLLYFYSLYFKVLCCTA